MNKSAVAHPAVILVGPQDWGNEPSDFRGFIRLAASSTETWTHSNNLLRVAWTGGGVFHPAAGKNIQVMNDSFDSCGVRFVAQAMTFQGPTIDGFKVVDWMGCKAQFVAVFNGQRGGCETIIDPWIVGSFLG